MSDMRDGDDNDYGDDNCDDDDHDCNDEDTFDKARHADGVKKKYFYANGSLCKDTKAISIMTLKGLHHLIKVMSTRKAARTYC